MKEKNKNKNKKKKTFAQSFCNDFEKLSLKLIESYVDESYKVIKSQNTCEKSDGGYDGYMLLRSSDDIEILTIMEAKLRSKNKDLPMSDFSKSIIIAINIAANCIYICTNLYFTENTIKELRRFIENTGLKIQTIDGDEINYWLNADSQNSQDFKHEFISQLNNYTYDDKTYSCKQLSISKNCKQLFYGIEHKEIYGLERKKLKENLLNAIKKEPKTIIIKGKIGIGKKTFINNILNQLITDKAIASHTIINKVDLGEISSFKNFCYHIISMFWGCSYNETVDFILNPEDSENLLTAFAQRSTVDLLKQLFDKSSDMFNSDVFFQYLYSLFETNLKRKSVKHIFVFYNMENINDSSVAKHIITFIRVFTNKIHILVAMPDKSSINEMISRESWDDFFKAIEDTRFTVTDELHEWDEGAAIKYIKSRLNKEKDKDIEEKISSLISYFGCYPNCLAAAMDLILDDKSILSFLSQNISVDINVAFYFAKIKSVIKRQLENSTEEQRKLVYLISFFNGKIKKIAAINILGLSETEIDYLTEGLPYVDYLDDFYIFSRRIYIQIISEIPPQEIYAKYYSLIDKVLDNIDYQCDNQTDKNESLLKIYLCKKKTEILKKIYNELLNSYKSNEQYDNIYVLTKKILSERIFENQIEFTVSLSTELLMSAIRTGHLNDNNEDISGNLDMLFKNLNTLEALNTIRKKELNLAYGRYYYIASKIHLAKSDYDNMKTDTENGLDYLKADTSVEALELQSELCASHAVSLKHLENIESCVSYLKDNDTIKAIPAVQKMPKYVISYHTHYASLFTGNNPEKALDEFNCIKDICKKHSRESYLHNMHNISSMKFIIKDYEGAEKDAKTVYEEAYNYNISVEYGRSQNVLGCIEWHRNNITYAKTYFKNCYKYFLKRQHNTHVWAPLVNLSTLCTVNNDKDAKKYNDEAAEFLLSNHKSQIKNANITPDGIPKIYVAILLILNNYCIIGNCEIERNDLLKNLQMDTLQTDYEKYVLTSLLEEYLSDTAYYCEGKIMLKV